MLVLMIYYKTVQKLILISFSNNVQEMAEKCRSSNVNSVFISGVVHAERFNVKTIENIHDNIRFGLSLC